MDGEGVAFFSGGAVLAVVRGTKAMLIKYKNKTEGRRHKKLNKMIRRKKITPAYTHTVVTFTDTIMMMIIIIMMLLHTHIHTHSL